MTAEQQHQRLEVECPLKRDALLLTVDSCAG
jgi:hypothetical protein